MAGNTEQRTIEIILKGQQATASIKEMGAASAVMKAQLDKMSADDPGRAKLQRDYTEMSQRLKEANTAARTLVKTTEELAAEQAAANAEAVRVVVNGKKVSATYNEMDAAAKQLEKDIKDLTPGTAEFIKKSKELQEVKGRMEEVDKSVKGTEKSTWAAKLGLDGITSASGLMKAGFQAAMAALLPLLAIEKIWEMVQAFAGVVNEVDEVKAAVNTATNAQGESLDGLVVKVRALSSTFGDEYGDVLKAADVLAKQMGISHEEAFDVIEKGYLAGANRSGEFLDNVKEYSVQLKDAGFSAQEFVAYITKAEMGGVFSDKGADTVKEFGLRIREQTTATRDALDAAFGQDFTNRIFKGINDGSLTVKDAMKEVGAAMNDTRVDASKLQTVVADVFGGPGEDAGLDYLKSLKDVGVGLDSLIDSSNAYVQMQQEQLAANKLLSEAEERLAGNFAGSGNQLNNLWAITKAYVYTGISNFIDWMEKLRASVMGSISYLGSWSMTVGKVFTMLKSGDFSGAKAAFGSAGKDAAEAYTLAYTKVMQEGAAKRTAAAALDKKNEAGTPQPGDIKIGDSSRKDDEKAEKAAEAARKKAHDKELADAKKHAAELKKAREDAEKAQLEATRNAEDLRVALIKDKYEREIQGISLQTDRKMEALKGDDEQIMAQWELLEQQRQEKIAAVRLKQKEDEEKLKQESLAKQVEQEQLDTEVQEAQLALAFEQGLLGEQAYQDALFNLKRVALANQLELTRQMKGEESAEYKRINNQIVLNEADRVKREKQQKQDLRTFDLNMQRLTASLLVEGLALIEDNLNKKSDAYKVFKAMRKAAEIAEIGINLAAEIQAIWKAASQNPLNGVTGGAAGAIQGGLQTGLAVARATGAAIKVAAFKDGGNTGRAQSILDGRQALAMLSGASGGSQAPNGSFVGGGPIDKPTIGLIGEAGAELVIPNWLYADPKQADLMGFLEAQIASKGNAFAAGGTTVPGMSMGSSPASSDDSVTGPLGQLVQVMVQLNGRLEGVEDWQRNLTVQNNLQEVDRGLKVVQETQTGGGIRKKE